MNPVLARWAAWRALTRLQRRAVLQSWCLLPLVWWGLRVWGLQRLHAHLQAGPSGRPSPARKALLHSQALGEAANIAARHSPFPVTCLSRSLVLLWLLRRHALAGELRIGVRLNGEHLLAHAWVECEGVPVNDRADIGHDYVPFEHLDQALDVPLA